MIYWKIIYVVQDGKRKKKRELTMLADTPEHALQLARLGFRIENAVEVVPLD